MSKETFCQHCQASLDNDYPPAQPCPYCGKLGRDVYVSAQDIIAAVDGIADLDIEHGPPLWEQRWRLLKHRLERLREGYGGHLDNAELENAADSFYLASHSMSDWLDRDASLPGINRRTVQSLVRNNLPLEICEGYANTSKHMVREATRIEARIKRYRSSPGKASLEIEYGLVNQPKQTIDALDLAEQCYDAWKAFLQSQELQT